MPEPVDLYRMVADQQAVLARLVASAHALANAPIWLVGPDSLIEASLVPPQLGRGGMSGFVVTSVTSEVGSCSERLVYADPGTGAPPKVEVSRSGDCRTGAPATGRQPSDLPAPQAPRPNQPPLIEASALGNSLPPAAKARYLAEQIKSAPPS